MKQSNNRSQAVQIVICLFVVIIGLFGFMHLRIMLDQPICETPDEPFQSDGNYDFSVLYDSMGYNVDGGCLSRGLKPFYDRTGVQPYIFMVDIPESITDEDDITAYAESLYDSMVRDGGKSEKSWVCFFMMQLNTVIKTEDNVSVFNHMRFIIGDEAVTNNAKDVEKIFSQYWSYLAGFKYVTVNDRFIKCFEYTADVFFS